MSSIMFSCSSCNQDLDAPPEMAGQTVQCPKCQAEISVPAPHRKDSPAWAHFVASQDTKAIEKVYMKAKGLLTSGEIIKHICVQQGPLTIFPDAVVMTSRRLILCKPGVLGSMSFEDWLWLNVRDVKIKDGIFYSSLAFIIAGSSILRTIEKLPKDHAKKLYAFAQEMEEYCAEERRRRSLEETRAASGAVQVNTPQQFNAGQSDPAARLQKLNDMLKAGLITEAIYESKRNQILSEI